MAQTQHEVDGGIIIGALQVARERVTGESVADKQARRDQLKIYIDAMYYYLETGKDQPSSAELRELLGDPGDKAVREALQHWDLSRYDPGVTNPYPAQEGGPRSPFPQVRWRFERTETGAQLLLWVPLGCDLECKASPLRIPMSEEQAWGLTGHVDRVMSWAAPSVEGIFSAGPSPSEAAGQLAVCRYIVTSPDTVAHTRLAQATPWAHWAEQLTGDPGLTWLVDVFGVDDASFLGLAMTFGVTVTPAPQVAADGG